MPEIMGVCAYCGWNGKVRRYKGRTYCSGPNKCWKKRRHRHMKLERRAEDANEHKRQTRRQPPSNE